MKYYRILLTAILGVGFTLRLLYLLEVVEQPAFAFPEVDMGYHDAWARALVSGDWEGSAWHEVSAIPGTPYFRPPGYPFFMSLVYRVFGADYLTIRIAQILLGLGSVLLGYMLGQRWLGRSVGLLFSLFMASYWIFVYFEGELLEPSLAIFLGLLLIYTLRAWVDRSGFWRGLGSGVVFGLFALVRPNILLFGPAIIIWGAWIKKKDTSRSRLFSTFGGLILGALLCIAPVTIRNYRVANDVVLISANAEINLYIGNNEYADGLFVGRTLEFGTFGTSDLYADIVQALEREQGCSLKYSEVSSYFAREAWRFIREQPGRFVQLLVRKVLLFWGPMETGHNKSIHYDRAFSPVLSAIPGNFAWALAWAVIGSILLIAHPRGRSPVDRRLFVLILLFIAVYSSSFLPFFVTGQYRVPVIPFLLLFGAYAWIAIFRFIKARDLKRAGIYGLLGIALYGIASIDVFGYEPNLAKWHFDRGVAYEKGDDRIQAQQAYEKAMEIDPEYAPPVVNLGMMAARRGDMQGAETLFKKALTLHPRHPERVHNNLGNSLVRQGRVLEAIPHYQTALILDPDLTEAHKNLGFVLLDQGRAHEAIVHFERAIALDPDSPYVYMRWGDALTALGRKEEAAFQYEKARNTRAGASVDRGGYEK